jgi:DNA-binding response OmpR family regulator
MNKVSEVLVVGALELRVGEGLAWVEGRALVLTKLEFGLLLALARGAGQTIRREDLYQEVWGFPHRLGDRSVDVYVHRLRGKLEEALPGRNLPLIHTHTGWGYRLEPEQQDKAPKSSRSAPLRSATGSSRRSHGSIGDRRGSTPPTNYSQGRHK